MIRHRLLEEVEPEQGQLGQHPALLRNAGGEHIVERRDPVRGHEQQMIVANLIQVADLSAGEELEVGKISVQKNVESWSRIRHGHANQFGESSGILIFPAGLSTEQENQFPEPPNFFSGTS